MLIGDKSTFAIECYHEPVANDAQRVYGRMCVWVRGQSLGRVDEPTCWLNETAEHLDTLLSRIDSLRDVALTGLSSRAVYDTLDHALYANDGRSDERFALDAERFSKFDFLTNCGESFDQSKSFIAINGDQCQIIFEDELSGFVAADVPKTELRSVIARFIERVHQEGSEVA